MKDPRDACIPPSQVGNLAKPAPKTPAQRAKAYRNRKKAEGLKVVKTHLPPEAVAYLKALSTIHSVTMSEAVALALMAAMRGQPIPRP
jgi:hypothetical protein